MNIGLRNLINIPFKLNRIPNIRYLTCLNGRQKLIKRSLLFTTNITSKQYFNQERKEKNRLKLSNNPLVSYFPSFGLRTIPNRIKMWFVMKSIDPNFKYTEFLAGCEQVGLDKLCICIYKIISSLMFKGRYNSFKSHIERKFW